MSETVQETFHRHVQMRMHKDGTPMPFPFIVLGIVGEFAEAMDEAKSDLHREKLINEVGDVLWYIEAARQTKWGGCFEDDGCHINSLILYAVSNDFEKKSLLHHLGAVSEMGKKEAWHGKPAPLDKLAQHLSALVVELDQMARVFDFTLEDAMRANIIKLEARYPMGIFVEGGGIREGAGA